MFGRRNGLINKGGAGGTAGTIQDASGDTFVVGDIAEGESIERSGSSFVSADYQAQIDTLTAAQSALTTRVSTAENDIDSLDLRLDDAESTLGFNGSDIAALGDRVDDLEAAGGAGKTLVASDVAGSAQQHLTVTYAFQTGRSYKLQGVSYIGSPGTAQTITLKPNNTVTSNMFQEYIGGFNATPVAGRDTTADIYGDQNNEAVYITIEWDEVAGQDRRFVVSVLGWDEAPLIDYENHIELIWAQTPAETALTSIRLAGSHSATANTDSYLKLFDMGPA